MSLAKEPIPKSLLACNYCRLKKVRCSGQEPCRNCESHGEVCCFTPTTRRVKRKPREAKETQRLLQDRLEKAESLLRQAGITFPSAADDHDHNYNHNHNRNHHDNNGSASATTSLESRNRTPAGTDMGDARLSSSPHITNITVASSDRTAAVPQRNSSTSRRTLEPKATPNSTDTLQLHSGPLSVHCDGSESPLEEELHGPGSYLSICSHPAAEWVSEQIGNSGFTDSAASLTNTVYRDLKMQTPVHHGQMPEPDLACAMGYAKAYFEQAFESAFDIIDRAAFETRLKAQFSGTESSHDPAWYALRAVVYAFGCRNAAYRETVPESWGDAQRKSWRYFENALSVYTELVHFRSNISMVQALLAMAVFVEGLGHPKLEYMLISTAVRLAQSKGLHLQPASTSKLSASEIALRSRLFWTMYAYEKHVAYRAGRPSMINDDHIECFWPEPVAGQPSIKIDFFHHVIRHAQISSAIIDQLTTAKARRRKRSQTLQTVNEIHERLKSWYESIPETLRFPGSHPVLASPDIRIAHLTYLHLAYHGSLAAIHSVFAYPWDLSGGESDSDIDISPQIEASTQILAGAARSIILSTKYLHISAAAPAWELFLYPIVGMINLFVCILKHPSRASAASDLGLLQMGAGYFGYLEYATASLRCFPFAGDIAKLAQKAMEKVQESHGSGSQSLPASTICLENGGDELMNQYSWDEEIGGFDMNGMGLDNLVSFLPSLNQVALMDMDAFPFDSMDFSIRN